MNDLRCAWRQIRLYPGFALLVVGILALGMGANTAIFSVYNTVVLHPLPFSAPDQLVQILKASTYHGPMATLGRAEVEVCQGENPVLEQIAAYGRGQANWSGVGEAMRVSEAKVTASFLPLLRVAPVLGRNFSAEEDGPGGPSVVLLGYRIWQKQFGGAVDALGKTIWLDDRPHTVVGVLPDDLRFPGHFDILLPLAMGTAAGRGAAELFTFQVEAIGRLRTGVPLEQAQSVLDGMYQAARHPKDRGTIVLEKLRDRLVGVQGWNVGCLFVGVGAVLSIACINVASLLLVRGTGRRKEMAIRAALGAGRWRILRQLLTESLLLSLFGGLLGLLVAYWSRQLLAPFVTFLPQVRTASLDLWTLGFNFGTALVVGVLFGLVPALGVARSALQPVLSETSPGAGVGSSSLRLQNLFVVTEISVALLLLLLASLATLSVWRAGRFDPGFKAERLLSFSVALSPARYADTPARMAFFERVQESVRALPGIEGVAMGVGMPLISGSGGTYMIESEGAGNRTAWVTSSLASPDYFKTLGIPVRQGRVFDRGDRLGTAPVAIVNESYVKKILHQKDPLGQPVRNMMTNPPTVVGVVGDVKTTPDLDPEPRIYLPYSQGPPESLGQIDFAVKTHGQPRGFLEALRGVLAVVDPAQPLYDVKTMDQRLADVTAFEWSMIRVFGTVSAIAIGLAALGIYGVVAYAVARRTREIGIRMALGATRGQVLGMVLIQGLGISAVGAVVGLLAGVGFTAFIIPEFYGMPALNPWVFATVTGIVAAFATLASVLPARRAARVDPMVALRCE